MKVSNLHSLLNGAWYINSEYRDAMLPYLAAIFNGTTMPTLEAPAPYMVSDDGEIQDVDAAPSEESFVAVLPIHSPILKYDQECGPSGTKTHSKIMSQWENDPRIKGIVLDIDSGGGQVAGTGEFSTIIRNFKKPVVAYSDGYLCSAAYYIGAGANEIIMNPHADAVGSIGTMMSFVDLTGYYKKKGAKLITAYATKSTEKNKSYRQAVEEGDLSGLIKEELDPINDKFHTDIMNYRPTINEAVFTGKHYNDLSKALSLGLIDSLGTLNDAVARVVELSNKSKSKNEKDMKEYPAIDAILGEGQKVTLASGLFTSKQGAKLPEASLDALEGRIQTLTQDADKVNTAIADKAKAVKEQKALENAITAAATAAEVKEGATAADTIQAMADKIAEYGAQPGAKPTTAAATEDDPEDDGIVDANASHNKTFENA